MRTVLSYLTFLFQICGFLNGASFNWIEDQKVPYAVKGNEWVGFDNQESFDIKVIVLYSKWPGVLLFISAQEIKLIPSLSSS